MKNYKQNLLGALHILKTTLENYDVELAHNILVGGETSQSEEDKEQDLCEYLDQLDQMIIETWKMEGNPILINNQGVKISK